MLFNQPSTKAHIPLQIQLSANSTAFGFRRAFTAKGVDVYCIHVTGVDDSVYTGGLLFLYFMRKNRFFAVKIAFFEFIFPSYKE